jgi:CDGSH-type Zn-finger protein
MPEEPDPRVTVTMEKDGPLYVRGRVRLTDGNGEPVPIGPRIALCRCGGSGNKPFCDGTHKTMGFEG